MRAGALDRRITILIKTTARDAYNAPIETWADSFSEWAKKETTGSGEFYAAQKVNAQTTAVYTTRFTRRITEYNRIRDGNQIYEVLGPPNDVDGRRETLLISAKEVV